MSTTTLQRELLDKLSALEIEEHNKKEALKEYGENIKFLRKEIKRLRGELEASRAVMEAMV